MKLSIFIVILAAICGNTIAKEKNEIKEVFADKAKKTILTEKSLFPGTLTSRVYSQLSPQNNVIVKEVLVQLGAKVSSGTRLLKVANQDVTLNYRASFLEAPVGGTVSWIGVQKGNLLSAGDVAIIITDPVDLYVKLEIPIKDLTKIHNGMSAKFLGETTQDKLDLEVIGIGSLVDTTTGTVPVELKLSRPAPSNLKSGVIGKIEFEFKSEPLMLVKDSAVAIIGAENFIRIIEKEKVKKVKVEIGKKTDGNTVILSGLDEGQQYVVQSSNHLSDGDKVKIVEQ